MLLTKSEQENWTSRAGGDIYIHGLPNGYGFLGAAHRARDWTDGCIAVTDPEIERDLAFWWTTAHPWKSIPRLEF